MSNLLDNYVDTMSFPPWVTNDHKQEIRRLANIIHNELLRHLFVDHESGLIKGETKAAITSAFFIVRHNISDERGG